MTTELQEAQAKLELQRREKAVQTHQLEPVEKTCADVFGRIKPKSDAELDAAKLRDQAEARTGRIAVLKTDWNAPPRHISRTEFSNPQWLAVLGGLIARLGTGFLVGIVGPNGPGKTQLGVEVMRHCVEQRVEPARYHTAMEVFIRIKATYRKDSDHTEEDVIKALCRPRLLVIDEAGKRADTAWENNVLFELVDRRYREMRDTLLISNQTRAEFQAGIGSGLTSRLNETGGMIEATWGSFREKA